MQFLTYLRYLPTIIAVIRELKAVIERVVKSDSKLPTCEDSKVLIKQVRVLLEKGVIDIEGIDEKAIADALLSLENNIVCTVDQAHRNIARFGDVKPRLAAGEGGSNV